MSTHHGFSELISPIAGKASRLTLFPDVQSTHQEGQAGLFPSLPEKYIASVASPRLPGASLAALGGSLYLEECSGSSLQSQAGWAEFLRRKVQDSRTSRTLVLSAPSCSSFLDGSPEDWEYPGWCLPPCLSRDY